MNKKQKIQQVCGEYTELFYDESVKKLNLELAFEKTHGTNIPLILFQDWTKQKTRTFFKLHIKEAIALKSMIEALIVEYHENLLETHEADYKHEVEK